MFHSLIIISFVHHYAKKKDRSGMKNFRLIQSWICWSIGRTKDSLLLSTRYWYWSTNSYSGLFRRINEIYRVGNCSIVFSIFDFVCRTFGFDDPCEIVHFEKTRLLIHPVERDIYFAMVKSNSLRKRKKKNFFSFRTFISLVLSERKTRNTWQNISMITSTIESCYLFSKYPIDILW